jgi:hypothetical protein
MSSLENKILQFEKLLNWSLKDDKFVIVPEDLRDMDLSFLWEELDEMGYTSLFKREGKILRVKVIKRKKGVSEK